MREKELKKLVRVGGTNTRVVSIPKRVLEKAGVNPENELFGEWRVEGEGRLVLIVTEYSL